MRAQFLKKTRENSSKKYMLTTHFSSSIETDCQKIRYYAIDYRNKLFLDAPVLARR